MWPIGHPDDFPAHAQSRNQTPKPALQAGPTDTRRPGPHHSGQRGSAAHAFAIEEPSIPPASHCNFSCHFLRFLTKVSLLIRKYNPHFFSVSAIGGALWASHATGDSCLNPIPCWPHTDAAVMEPGAKVAAWSGLSRRSILSGRHRVPEKSIQALRPLLQGTGPEDPSSPSNP